jgi:hypothetical protein
MHISLKDLIVDSSELVNIPNAPTITLRVNGVEDPSGLSLCMLAGAYVNTYSSTSSPAHIVLGSLPLRSLYVGIDVDINNPRIGLANKRPAASVVTAQCAAPVICSGSQYPSLHQNSCRNCGGDFMYCHLCFLGSDCFLCWPI